MRYEEVERVRTLGRVRLLPEGSALSSACNFVSWKSSSDGVVRRVGLTHTVRLDVPLYSFPPHSLPQFPNELSAWYPPV